VQRDAPAVGTLTSYLMAWTKHTRRGPSCNIHEASERLFATIGPQEAEKKITGQVAIGLDQRE